MINTDDLFNNNDLMDTINDVELYIPEHVHTEYSLLDGACRIDKLLERAKELGFPALAITDHNHLGGTLEFQKQCKAAGIKPLLGYEGYFTKDINIARRGSDVRNRFALYNIANSDEEIAAEIPEELKHTTFEEFLEILPNDKLLKSIKKENKDIFKQYSYDMKQYHILYLAMNQTGWNNLVKLQSKSSELCTFNGRYLADLDLIKKYSEGVICTAACIGSIFSHLILQKKEDEAKALVIEFQKIFGDRFYLEIQPLAIYQQAITNKTYMKWSKELGIKTIATTDTHYILKEDWDDHDSLICVSTKSLKDEKDRMRYSNDFWLKSTKEMSESFIQQEQTCFALDEDAAEIREFWKAALRETVTLADRIDPDITIGSKTTLYPSVVGIPKDMTADDVLWTEAFKGLKRYAKEQSDLNDPIDYELYAKNIFDEMNVITKKHYSTYFLAVKEYINWCNAINPDTNQPNCITGPGRGSAGASVVAFLIGITKNIDPIKNGLMFSRFLNSDRTSPPDWKRTA